MVSMVAFQAGGQSSNTFTNFHQNPNNSYRDIGFNSRTDRERERERERERDRQRDRQTKRSTDMQAGRQTDRPKKTD